MKIFRKLKILRKLYKSGYVDKEISDEVVFKRIKEKMQFEEEMNDRRIHELEINNLLLKNKIIAKNNDDDEAL